MIDPKVISRGIKAKFIGKRILYYESLASTNIEAQRLVNESKAQYGDLILATKQTAGKGQQFHEWDSPLGGLYLSLVVSSKVCEKSNLITFMTGVACIHAIKKVTNLNCSLKWVNDVLFSKQKLAGILIETSTRGDIATHVVGIGINVNAKITNADNIQFQPTSLKEILGTEIDINCLIAELCNSFEEYFNIYQTNPAKILSKWIEYSNIGEKQVEFYIDNCLYRGQIRGLNKLGHLIVNTEDKKEYILSSSKDVRIFL